MSQIDSTVGRMAQLVAVSPLLAPAGFSLESAVAREARAAGPKGRGPTR